MGGVSRPRETDVWGTECPFLTAQPLEIRRRCRRAAIHAQEVGPDLVAQDDEKVPFHFVGFPLALAGSTVTVTVKVLIGGVSFSQGRA